MSLIRVLLRQINVRSALGINSHFLTAQRNLVTVTTHLNDNSSDTQKQPSAGEKRIADLLRARFPNANSIEVNDISGGCGSMYEVFVETSEFKNIRTVKQHQLISEALKKEIAEMHGIRIFTGVPEQK